MPDQHSPAPDSGPLIERLFETERVEVTRLDLWQFRLFQLANAVSFSLFVLGLTVAGIVALVALLWQ